MTTTTAIAITEQTAEQAAQAAAIAHTLANYTGVLKGYARVSTDDQHPEVQTDRLLAVGVLPENLYVDKGYSGTLKSRPAWDRLMEGLRPGDVLVSVKLDRIGRSVLNLCQAIADIRDLGASLWVIDQNIETITDQGKLMFHVFAAFAEFEKALILQRSKDGLDTLRKTGNMRRIMSGQVPLGFLDPGGDDDHDLVLDPPVARWLAAGAALVLADPEHRVEVAYNAMPPIMTSKGKTPRPVTLRMFRDALRRPASAGLIELKGESFGTIACGGPLDMQTYKRLRVIFAARETGRKADPDVYPFGPLLLCDRCGNVLTGMKLGEIRYYCCNVARVVNGVPSKPCRGNYVHVADVHALLRGAVEEWSLSPAAVDAAAAQPRYTGRRAMLEAVIGEQRQESANLTRRMRSGFIDKADHDELVAESEELILGALRELDELDVLESEPALPQEIDWEAMTVPERYAAIKKAVQTPIRVRTCGRGRRLTAEDRITLVPR